MGFKVEGLGSFRMGNLGIWRESPVSGVENAEERGNFLASWGVISTKRRAVRISALGALNDYPKP